MRRLAALLILALGLLAGCSRRAHLNPFDPDNPDTGGRPEDFVALAANQGVILRWRATSSPGLIGYQIFRRGPDDADYRPLTGVLPAVTSSIGDFGLANGRDHRYRIYYVFDRGLGALPAEDVATPGPLRPWVSDYDARLLVRLTADGRHLAETLNPTGAVPAALDVDPVTGTVWTCGPDGGVLAWNPGTGQRMLFQGFPMPVSVLVDRVGRSVWIGDAINDQAVHLDLSGVPVDPPVLTSLDWPGSLALDERTRALWVVEQDGNRVRKYSASGALLGTASVDLPSRVSVDEVTHEAWVTSFQRGRVVRLSPFAVPLDTITACSGPIGIVADPLRQRVWVADASGSQVVALRHDGTVEFRIGNQPDAREVALDDSTGEVWATLPAAGAVSRLSPDGREILRVGGMTAPYAIALDDLRDREYLGAGGAAPATAARVAAPPSRRVSRTR